MHRVILPFDNVCVNQPCWSLFIHSAKIARWGTIIDSSFDTGVEGSKFYVEGGTGLAREWWKTARSENQIRWGRPESIIYDDVETKEE